VDARAPRLAAGRVIGIKSCPTPPRVLVADDQETNRSWLRELLSLIGFDVMEAMDGVEAVELWRTWKPDLVLMDLHMPVMDGHEAMRAIRREPRGDQVALIAISASVLEEDRQDVLRSGADAFVGKPVREGDLLSKIQVLLGLEYLHREEASPVTAGAPMAPVEAPGPALAQWPTDVLSAMREASERADIDRLRRLITDSKHSNESAASELLALVNRYDYEGLDRALGGSRARDKKS
jgi:CheY-like chemotaxis protein